MIQKVKLSTFCIVLTWICNIVLIACCILTFPEKVVFGMILCIFLAMFISALIYAPVSIKADEEYLTLISVLKKHRLRMRNIEGVELFQPTMGAIRIFASGGYMGYWGIFREGDVGRYSAFYGRSSDCMLVRMKNGDKYVIGCENKETMVDLIKALSHKAQGIGTS